MSKCKWLSENRRELDEGGVEREMEKLVSLLSVEVYFSLAFYIHCRSDYMVS